MGILRNYHIENRCGRGFTQIDNQPLDGIDELSFIACCIWIKLLRNKNGWELKWENFEKKHGISNDARIKGLKELTEKGYYLEDKYRDGRIWKYNYFVFEYPLTLEEQNIFKEKIFPILRNVNSEFQIRLSDFGFPKCTQYYNNTNINNTNLNNIEDNKAEINFRSLDSSENFNNENITCNHDSETNLTFSKKHDLQNNMENSGGDTNLNKTIQPVTIPKKSKSTKTHKGIVDGKVSRNAMEVAMAQPKQSVNVVLNGTGAYAMGGMTEETKLKHQEKDTLMEIQDKLYDLNAKNAIRKNTQNSRKEKIFGLIKKEFTGDLQKVLLNYMEFYIESGKKMIEVNYRAFLEKLNKLSNGDEQKKIEIVKTSLSNCWLEIFPLNEKNNNKTNYKSNATPQFIFEQEDKQKEEYEESDYYTAATDENGNLLMF